MPAGRSGEPEALKAQFRQENALIGPVSALQGGLVGLSLIKTHYVCIHSSLGVCKSHSKRKHGYYRLTGLTGGV